VDDVSDRGRARAGRPTGHRHVRPFALNVLAFFVELSQPSEGALQSFTQAWGVVPREYSAARDLPPTILLPFWSTLLTSMFLHGGWMRLGGNMLYLWFSTTTLEKVMGAARLVIFYLAYGLAASFAHIVFGSGSNVSRGRGLRRDQRRARGISRPLPT
jgi:membrane associated rhomboid family serine protease